MTLFKLTNRDLFRFMCKIESKKNKYLEVCDKDFDAKYYTRLHHTKIRIINALYHQQRLRPAED